MGQTAYPSETPGTIWHTVDQEGLIRPENKIWHLLAGQVP